MIDTGAIRNIVLDFALQGKLTLQLKSDGSADELYKKVQEERASSIKKGEISKKKLLPIQEVEKPFVIPTNWKWIRLGDLSKSIQYGYNAPAKSEGSIKMVRISDIQDNKVMWDTVPYCEIDEDSVESYLLHENDILFARTGGTVGKSYIVSDIPEKAVFAGYLIRTSYSLSLNSKYMKYFMESRLYWKQLQSGTIATAQPNCNGKTLSKMIVPLPPAAEQIRIVDKVDAIFSLLSTVDDLQTKYAADRDVLKSKLINAAICGKLTKQLPEDGTAEELYQQIQEEKKRLEKEGKIKKSKTLSEIMNEEIPFEIPRNWKWLKITDIASVVTDGEHKTPKRISDFKGYYLLSARNVLNGKISLDDVDYVDADEYDNISKRCNPQRGDVLISCSGTVGRVAVVEDDNKYVMVRSAAMIRAIMLNPKYLMYVLQSSNLQLQIERSAKQTAQANLFQKEIRNLRIPLPPFSEQQRIVDTVDSLIENM